MVKWNVSGDWVLTQSDGRTVEIKLVQGTDGTLGGSGDFVDLPRDGWPTNPSRDRSSPKGSPARSLTMVSAWRSIGFGASVGSYEARIDQEGNIFDGVGRDILNPNNRVSFTANRRVSPQEEAPYEEGPRDGTRLGSPAVGIDPPPRCGSTFVRPDLMATVISDVDLYDVPGGVGEVIGMLVEGSRNGPFIRGCDAPMVVKRRRECCPRSLWG